MTNNELTNTTETKKEELAYTPNSTETNNLDFKYERPVIKSDGTLDQTGEVTIQAPLLALVPVPAFTMDELDIDFNMESKNMERSTDQTHTDASATASYKSWWGLDASISGNVVSDTEHKRQTDSSATYNIQARAVQEPPSEGVAKLTSLLNQAMEPISDQES